MKKIIVIICVLMLSSGIAFAEGVGYWKNHDEERNAFVSAAVSGSIDILDVFLTEHDLTYCLTKKGKKTMLEKAEQQLAALLLTIASSLEQSALLTVGELEIYNHIVDPDVSQATVGDAVFVIEDVISNFIDTINIENAKDLADEINSRQIVP
jgi:hypothetical protein